MIAIPIVRKMRLAQRAELVRFQVRATGEPADVEFLYDRSAPVRMQHWQYRSSEDHQSVYGLSDAQLSDEGASASTARAIDDLFRV